MGSGGDGDKLFLGLFIDYPLIRLYMTQAPSFIFTGKLVISKFGFQFFTPQLFIDSLMDPIKFIPALDHVLSEINELRGAQ